MSAKLDRTGTPGVFRRHSGECRRKGRCDCSYVVVWRHRGRQHTATYRTLAEAREAKGQRDAGERKPVAKVTFGAYFETWIETYAGRTSRGFSDRSRELYRRSIEDHALPLWKSWKLAAVEATDVRDLLGQVRDSGYSASVIKSVRATLSALFATAVEDGLLRASPTTNVRVPAALSDGQEDGEPAKALTRAELAILLAQVPNEWRLFFEFLAHSGLRISEAVGLTWTHLDLGTNPRVQVREQIYKGQRVRLKSSRARRDIPLSAGMADRLRAHRRDNFTDDGAPVFTSRVGTALNSHNVAVRVLKPAGKAAGLTRTQDGEEVPWPSFHTFRHTCASMLFEAGRNVAQVAAWLGHTDPAFTLRTYVHLLDDGCGDAEFFDAAVNAEPSRVNTGSTDGPQTAANELAPIEAKTAA